MKRKALIIGGSSGIGLSIVESLMDKSYEKIYIFDKAEPQKEFSNCVEYHKFSILSDSFSELDSLVGEIDTLIITAGYGRVAPFSSFLEEELQQNLEVNAIAPLRVIKKFYNDISSKQNFYCAIMGSVAGMISSPLFSVYGAGKATVCKFIESINIELEMADTSNRILNVSPGAIKGTSFSGGKTKVNTLKILSDSIVKNMFEKETLYIPDIDVYGEVIERYKNNPHEFGIDSYNYKIKANRLNLNPQLKIGYLSGTFDLFHVGHLNLLKKAKQYCDYLIVGVHQDGSHKGKTTFISFDERVQILESIRYVDKVIPSQAEDKDVWQHYPYDFLFVGSDYKGTERFEKYEEFFSDKPTEIIYFDYTQGVSSSQLRKVIDTKNTLNE